MTTVPQRGGGCCDRRSLCPCLAFTFYLLLCGTYYTLWGRAYVTGTGGQSARALSRAVTSGGSPDNEKERDVVYGVWESYVLFGPATHVAAEQVCTLSMLMTVPPYTSIYSRRMSLPSSRQYLSPSHSPLRSRVETQQALPSLAIQQVSYGRAGCKGEES